MPSVAARGTGMRAMAEAVEQMMQRSGAGTRTSRSAAASPSSSASAGPGRAASSSTAITTCSRSASSPSGRRGRSPRRSMTASSTRAARPNSKGDLVARLAAVEAYQKTFGKLPVCLRFVVEGEDGSAARASTASPRSTPSCCAPTAASGTTATRTRGAPRHQPRLQGHRFPRAARLRRAHRPPLEVGRHRAEPRVASRAGALHRRLAERRHHDRRLLFARRADHAEDRRC